MRNAKLLGVVGIVFLGMVVWEGATYVSRSDGRRRAPRFLPREMSRPVVQLAHVPPPPPPVSQPDVSVPHAAAAPPVTAPVAPPAAAPPAPVAPPAPPAAEPAPPSSGSGATIAPATDVYEKVVPLPASFTQNEHSFGGVLLPTSGVPKYTIFQVGGSINFVGGGTAAYTVVVDWGDGASETFESVENGPNGVIGAKHKFDKGGQFNITVKATPVGGSTTTTFVGFQVDLSSSHDRHGKYCNALAGVFTESLMTADFQSYFVMQSWSEAYSLLRRMLLPTTRHYLEFGSGGSSYIASSLPHLTTITVESDPGFLMRVANQPVVRNAAAAGRWMGLRPKVGNIKSAGTPKDDSQKHLWPNYPNAVSDRDGKYDLILVDGRWRVACAATAIPLLAPGGSLAFHDYFRTQYHTIEKWMKVQSTNGAFAFLEPKPGVPSVPVADIPYHWPL